MAIEINVEGKRGDAKKRWIDRIENHKKKAKVKKKKSEWQSTMEVYNKGCWPHIVVAKKVKEEER